MSSRVQALQGAKVDYYIRQMHSVFEMHVVLFGSPRDLPPFLTRLREDRHLAMDFWALTSAITSNEGGDLPNDQLLDIIVRGVTGKDELDIRESGDDEVKGALDDINRLLAGVDIDSPPPETEDNWPPSEAELVDQSPVNGYSQVRSVQPATSEPPRSAMEEPAVERASTDEPLYEEQADLPLPNGDVVASLLKPWQAEADLRDDLPSSASPTLSRLALGEALSRLEMNSRKLQRHLDSIDNRMEELTSKVASPQHAKPNSQGPHDDLFDSGSYRKSGKRLVLRPSDDEPPIALSSLEKYNRSHRWGGAGWIALVLVLGGLLIALQKYHGPMREVYSARLQKVLHRTRIEVAREFHTIFKSAADAQPPAIPSADDGSLSSASSDDTTDDTPVTRTPPHPAGSQSEPDKQDSGNSGTASSTPEPSSVYAATGSRSDSSANRPSREPVEARENRAPSGLYDSDVPVSVSAGVMQQNLTTSRVPAYPEIAKVQGIEGSVLMQIVISKDGTVYEVHAIQGDEMLRGAAEDAVSRWRYRPYILNGSPVNVVTNVRVDFKLPRR